MQQFIFIIFGFLLFSSVSFSNELPSLTYVEQPILKNNKEATIVKFKKEDLKVKKTDKKIQESRVELLNTTNFSRRTYKSCTSFG